LNHPQLAIVGAGPVGSLICGYLSRAGNPCTLVDIRQDLVDTIRQRGLKIHLDDETHVQEVEVFQSLESLQEREIEFLFLCVKSIDLSKLIEPLKPFRETNTTFVCVQNGIDSEEVLAGHFDRNTIFRVAPNFAGMTLEPGVVKQSFFHPPNFLGTRGKDGVDKGLYLAELLSKSGLKTEFTQQYQKQVWRKSILNAALMPVSVITGATMQDLMEVSETRELVNDLLGEFLRIAKAEGFLFEANFKQCAIDYLSSAGHHKTSMLMDFEAGRPLEIPFLNHKFEEYAEKHGIHACKNKVLCGLIEGLVAQRDFHAPPKPR